MLPYTPQPFLQTSDLGVCIYSFQNEKKLWVDKAGAFPSVGLAFSLNPKFAILSQYAYHLTTPYELPPTTYHAAQEFEKNKFLVGISYRFG